MENALIFCRIRSFLYTCRKQGIMASHALDNLFGGQLTDFLHAKIVNLAKDGE
jgi:transposase